MTNDERTIDEKIDDARMNLPGAIGRIIVASEENDWEVVETNIGTVERDEDRIFITSYEHSFEMDIETATRLMNELSRLINK